MESYDQKGAAASPDAAPLEEHQRRTKTGLSAKWGVIACGAGLFADGYLNAMISFVKSILSKIYGPTFKKNQNLKKLLNPMTFAGTALGMLLFGFTSDHWSRKGSLLVSTVIIVVFAILQTASYGAGGTTENMITALIIYRFFLGIGIGGEYPAGSVGAAEHTASLKEGTRNRWFIWFSNVAIDMGFVLAPLVALIVVAITKEGNNGLAIAWRVCLGTGVLPPLVMFLLRLKLHEPEPFLKESMTLGRTPWYLILRFYWWRLLLVSTVWFLYDFCSYAFYLFQGDMLINVYPDTGGPGTLLISFGWEVLIALFLMPGCILGSYLADMPSIGPKKLLIVSLVLQGVVGFILAAAAPSLLKPSAVGGFVVLFGIFLALGEVGPGDTIGLFASKTSATAVRGKYYGWAAAIGKMGAFTGNYAFGQIAEDPRWTGVQANQVQFYLGSGLCILSAVVALLLPNLSQDVVAEEDARFRRFLEEQGYDTSTMGVAGANSSGDIVRDPDSKAYVS